MFTIINIAKILVIPPEMALISGAKGGGEK
jgi:hypothetical protein